MAIGYNILWNMMLSKHSSDLLLLLKIFVKSKKKIIIRGDGEDQQRGIIYLYLYL